MRDERHGKVISTMSLVTSIMNPSKSLASCSPRGASVLKRGVILQGSRYTLPYGQ